MTTLTRPVRRKVTTLQREPLVVTLLPEGIQLREPRRRTGYLLPYGTAFVHAARLHVDAQRTRARRTSPAQPEGTNAVHHV